MLHRFLLVILIISLSVNLWTIFFSRESVAQPLTENGSTEPSSESFPFIAKRLFVEDPNDIIINFVPLREKLQQYAEPYGEKLGIYFEYLPTGNHIGIYDRDAFRRASLVKLPVIMRVYKLIEEGKIAKNDPLVIAENQIDSGSGKLWKKGAGTTLTVEEAIGQALVDSDNTAFNALRDLVNTTLDKEAGSENETLYVYDYLDIPREENGDKTLNISPRGFASILKSLYFSAYLSFKNSNEILEILATPTRSFNMLSAPIPDNIRTADKYGINREGPDESLVTSDCGLVFYPKRPYVLCVMVNSPPEDAADIVVAVSRMVFEFIKSISE